MISTVTLLLFGVFCPSILSINDVDTSSLKQIEQTLDEQLEKLGTLKTDLGMLAERHRLLRIVINKMHDDKRMTSFELNNICKYCLKDVDRYTILREFCAEVGISYRDSDVLAINYYWKKFPGYPEEILNYIVRLKSVYLKEQWMDMFTQYVKQKTHKDVFDFPGVNRKYSGFHPNNQSFYDKRYSLVDVKMRDHLSPYKMSLMSVVRGRIKPKRHQFRVKINRSRLIVDRMLPLRMTVRQYISDFSDILRLDSM
uniref:Uncharacterized protein n=1 Tax=Cacopsylla melanoneura TaxID=428564 RepID=A0A8D8RWA7_9HEMI